MRGLWPLGMDVGGRLAAEVVHRIVAARIPFSRRRSPWSWTLAEAPKCCLPSICRHPRCARALGVAGDACRTPQRKKERSRSTAFARPVALRRVTGTESDGRAACAQARVTMTLRMAADPVFWPSAVR